MGKTREVVIDGSRDKKIILDHRFAKGKMPKGIVIFAHGYKGFKDWGAWNLVSQTFAKNDYHFIKFNFSYNGGTIANPIDFPDPEAFGQNNYSTELNDLGNVIDWVKNGSHIDNELPIFLIGHSRGGGITLLKSAQDKRVQAASVWAAVSSFEERFPIGKKMDAWYETGVYHIKNSRTGQDLPHYIQFYIDYVENESILNIRNHCKVNTKPVLVLHGDEDEAVHIANALKINKWLPKGQLQLISGAGHTFGMKHPWEEKKLPPAMKQICESTMKFFIKKG